MKNLETTQKTQEIKNYFTPLEIINIYNVDNKNERELNKTRKKAKTDRIQVNNFIINRPGRFHYHFSIHNIVLYSLKTLLYCG